MHELWVFPRFTFEVSRKLLDIRKVDAGKEAQFEGGIVLRSQHDLDRQMVCLTCSVPLWVFAIEAGTLRITIAEDPIGVSSTSTQDRGTPPNRSSVSM